MHLALFDLDHTLIPFDSGSAFTRFLAERGALPAGFAAEYLAYCQRYAAGSVDMVEMHRFTVGALAPHPPARLQAWIDEFATTLPPLIPAASQALVAGHRAAGHCCLLVTATTRLVAEPFARALGFDIGTELLPTEPVRDACGHVTGEIIGAPCFRKHKIDHVGAWLQRQGLAWSSLEGSWFYSDSMNDLPLLQHVRHPVVVNADPRLAAYASAEGWLQQHIGA